MEQKTSITLDVLDHQLIQALQLDGRVPFARFAQLVGVSEQTVARRFRRLRAAGVVRVLGMVDPMALGESSWTVRIQSQPDAAVRLAETLARRPDVSWVSLTSGGSEIICAARSWTSRQRDELLLHRLPKTAQVTSFSAQALLHRFDSPTSWTPGIGQLDDVQIGELRSQAIGAGSTSEFDASSGPLLSLTPPEEALLAKLALDGRTPIVRLATVTGWTPARVTRRLDELVRDGLLYFDLDIAPDAFGFRCQAFLWLTVGAADLQRVGTELAGHDVVAFAAATTGASNLIASVVCRDNAHLYGYVTEELGAIDALRQLEISPVLRRVKQGGSLMDGERLAPARNHDR